MPIKPENKALYPDNWNEISQDIRFNRAKNHCEVCGIRNYSVGSRNATGDFVPACGNIIEDLAGQGLKYPSLKDATYLYAKTIADAFNEIEIDNDIHFIVIVLTVAHLDHNPVNCDYSNLKAMCQKCHNNYDQQHRKQTRRNTKYKGMKPLF